MMFIYYVHIWLSVHMICSHMIITYDNNMGFLVRLHMISHSHMMFTCDVHIWFSVHIWYSHMICTYDAHIWYSHMICRPYNMFTYDDHMWLPHMNYWFTYDAHIWGSHMIWRAHLMITCDIHIWFNVHIWCSHMIPIYEIQHVNYCKWFYQLTVYDLTAYDPHIWFELKSYTVTQIIYRYCIWFETPTVYDSHICFSSLIIYGTVYDHIR